MEFVQTGKLGKVSVARGPCYKPRGSIGTSPARSATRRTMDYNLWCGPAANRPPHRNSPANGTVHYDWHWIWEYGNGDLGNQGIHQMDVARWGLSKIELPRSAISLGGRFGYIDDGETPNTQMFSRRLRRCRTVFEVRGLRTDPYRGAVDRQRLPLHRRLPRLHLVQQLRRFQQQTTRNCAASAAAAIITATSSAPSARAAAKICMATSSRAIFPAPCATWPISAIASAGPPRLTAATASWAKTVKANETLTRMVDRSARQQR